MEFRKLAPPHFTQFYFKSHMGVLLVSNSGIFYLLCLSQRLGNKNWAWEISIWVLMEMLRISEVSRDSCLQFSLLLYLFSQTLNPPKMKKKKVECCNSAGKKYNPLTWKSIKNAVLLREAFKPSLWRSQIGLYNLWTSQKCWITSLYSERHREQILCR